MYEFSSFLALLWRRRVLAVSLYAALLVVGCLGVLLLPRTYVTSAQVLVNRPPSSLPQTTEYPQIDALLAWNSDTAMQTYLALAQEPAVAEQVIRQLNLSVTPKQLLADHVVVTPLTNADIINIAVDWHDAQGSSDVANAFARTFIERQRILAAARASQAADSLAIALRQARANLENVQTRLTIFESQHDLADVAGQQSAILAAIEDMQTKERTAQSDWAQARAQLSSIGSHLAAVRAPIDSAQTTGSSPVTDQIESQLAQARLQLAVLRQQYTERYPDVIATEKQIASLQAALSAAPRSKVLSTTTGPNPLNATLTNQAAMLQAQIAGDSAQLNMLETQKARLSGQLRLFPSDAVTLTSLQRTTKSDEAIYEDLQSRYFNAVVAKRMAVSDLSLVRSAEPSLADVRPSRLLALTVVALAGLLATIAVTVLLDTQVQARASQLWQANPG